MFGFRKRPRLKDRVAELEKAVAELSKRTISQTTTADEPPVPYSQIIDEWLNGEEGNSGRREENR